MSDAASMEDISDATYELIGELAGAQRAWAKKRLRNAPNSGGLTERVAIWCALQALSNAFAIEKVVHDSESLQYVNDFANGIKLETTAVQEEDVARA